MSHSKPVQRFLILWVLGSLATVVGLALLTGLTDEDAGWWGYLRLVNAGVTTRAAVVRTDRGNHCLAEYSFDIDSQNYRGSGNDCDAHVGQGVTITYLRSDPNHSCLGFARDALNNELATFVVGGVIVPPFALFAVGRWRRRTSKSMVA
jgi:hypothetical protein